MSNTKRIEENNDKNLRSKKHIFVLSANVDRLEYFAQYFNIFGPDTDVVVHTIIDDRHVHQEDIMRAYELGYHINLVSDVIDTVVPMLKRPDLAHDILDMYGVSIKWLLFPYINRVLDIKKAMTLDDDTLLLRPLDHYFEHDYVWKRERLSKMNERVIDVLGEIINNRKFIEEINANMMFLNSGQMLYTDNDDSLMDFLNRVFDTPIYEFVKEGYDKYKSRNTSKIRGVGGYYWVIEQYIYCVFFNQLSKTHDVQQFGNDVFLETYNMKESYRIGPRSKPPAYFHYLPKDKEPFYKYYIPVLENYMKENRE